MARFLHRFYAQLQYSANSILLMLCFVAGFISGIRVCHGVEFSFALMRGALNSAVSIVHLLGVLLLPFLFSALAVYFSKPKLLYVIAFIKAFVFAFVSAGIYYGFYSAGWMARWLLMFSDCLCMPLLCLYWLRHIPGKRPFQAADAMAIAGGIGLVGLIDHMLVMPLLQQIAIL